MKMLERSYLSGMKQAYSGLLKARLCLEELNRRGQHDYCTSGQDGRIDLIHQEACRIEAIWYQKKSRK